MYDTGNGFEDAQIDNMTLGYSSGTNKLKTVTDAAPCPDNKVLHQAMDNTEIHAVGQTIEADNLVNETADIIYQAGTSVTLKAGFHAKAGTNFVAKIDNCPSGNYETGGFVQRSTNDYLYDINGNMVNDPNKGITNILFNYHNQPYKVIWANGNTIEWLYNGSGQKLQQLTKRNGTEINKLDYIDGSIEYEKDTIARIYLEDAKLTFDKGNIDGYKYFHKDHLMSTRVVFEDGGSGLASIISEHHTYAFGLAFDGDFTTNSSTKRLYNFKEEVSNFGLGWADFGERYYLGNGGIPRFLSVDPLAEKFAWVNPYNYAENKVPNAIDLHGLQAVWSAAQASRNPKSAQFQKENPKTAAAIAAVPLAIIGGIAAGPAATASFLANEVKDEVLSQATGGLSDIVDITKAGTKLLKSGLDGLKGLNKLDDAGLASIKGGSLFRKGKVDDFEFASGHGPEVIEDSDTYIKKIRDLSDEDLIKTLEPDHPSWGTITIKRGVILRGNNRLYEVKKRGLDVEFKYRQLVDDNREYFYDYDK